MLPLQSFLDKTHPEWQGILLEALKTMNNDYLVALFDDTKWLPGHNLLFQAFSLPISQTKYILFGESPYPRAQSANGYAFWDANVKNLWSDTGLAKEVNKATSLRNFLKMLLVARGDLVKNYSQASIAKIDKTNYIKTAEELFHNMMKEGILLLNSSLVYSKNQVNYHAKHWRVFIESLLLQLPLYNNNIQLILLGSIAKKISTDNFTSALTAEHPYNTTFINNPAVISFFSPLDLLSYGKYQ